MATVCAWLSAVLDLRCEVSYTSLKRFLALLSNADHSRAAILLNMSRTCHLCNGTRRNSGNSTPYVATSPNLSHRMLQHGLFEEDEASRVQEQLSSLKGIKCVMI